MQKTIKQILQTSKYFHIEAVSHECAQGHVSLCLHGVSEERMLVFEENAVLDC
jgi:hypothetical protein